MSRTVKVKRVTGSPSASVTAARRSAKLRVLAVALTLASALALAGCRRDPVGVDASPEAIVEEFVLRMQRVHGDPKNAREAYDLLWSEAKHGLAERAKRASAVVGREVAPEAMIAPTHFSLSFVPKRYVARVDGDWAIVTATGEAPSQRRDLKCVKEDGRWRVVLVLPQLPPIQRRPAQADEAQK
jgi:hypothetical protein